MLRVHVVYVYVVQLILIKYLHKRPCHILNTSLLCIYFQKRKDLYINISQKNGPVTGRGGDVKMSKRCQMSKSQTHRLWRRFTKKIN